MDDSHSVVDDNFYPLGFQGRQRGFEPASKVKRLLACLLDTSLFIIPFLMLTVGEYALPRGMAGIFVVLCPLSWVIFAVMQWLSLVYQSQTFGKWVMKTKIVCHDGTPANWMRTLLLRRWLPTVLDMCCSGGFTVLVDWPLIFRSDCRCVHDHMAGTIVIDLASSAPSQSEAELGTIC